MLTGHPAGPLRPLGVGLVLHIGPHDTDVQLDIDVAPSRQRTAMTPIRNFSTLLPEDAILQKLISRRSSIQHWKA